MITDLDTGGAERMLSRLLARLDRACFEVSVISLTDVGLVGAKIRELGVPVRALGVSRKSANPLHVLKLSYWLRESKPDLVHTWMYHADLIGGVAAKLAGGIPIVWCIRNGTVDPGASRSSRLAVRLCAWMSGSLPRRIISCSEQAREVHASLGYARAKMLVIPNGFDLDQLRRQETAKREVLNELEFPSSATLLGMVARFDPQKDHGNFVEAARLVCAKVPDACFLLCGGGITWENTALADLIRKACLQDRFRLLGPREDVSRVISALDVAVLSSYSESFPNVVAEAMACEVPCAVTDVGDSAFIVGDTGRVVPARDSVALAGAILELIELGEAGRRALGRRARARVMELFNLPDIARRYEALYAEVLAERKAGVSGA